MREKFTAISNGHSSGPKGARVRRNGAFEATAAGVGAGPGGTGWVSTRAMGGADGGETTEADLAEEEERAAGVGWGMCAANACAASGIGGSGATFVPPPG